MASILLLEHQTIVRDAIRHFLFPQHIVTAVRQLPASEELASYDAVIIDTETLAELDRQRDEVASLLARLNLPAVWVCPPETAMPEADAAGVFVAKPLEPQTFGGAVAQVLPAKTEGEPANERPADGERIIELTEGMAKESPDDETT